MRFPRRRTSSLAVLTLIAAGLAGCSSEEGPAAGTTDVVIGADLDANSTVDKAYANALALRVEQVNSSGALGEYRLVLRNRDNRAATNETMRNIAAFADDPAVAAVISGGCGECVYGAVQPINQRRLPTIALAAADEISDPVADRRYVFKLGPNIADSSAALIAELSRRKTKRVAVLYSDDLYGRRANTTMGDLLETARITSAATTAVKPGASDLSQNIATLTGADPDAIVVLAGPDLAALAARSVKSARFGGDLYFDAAAAGDMFIPQASAAATDKTTMVFTHILAIDDVIATTPAKAARKQWFRDYTSRFGTFSGVAAFAGDAVDLIAGAVQRAGGDRERIRDILETSQRDGLSGAIRITPDNHSGLMPQALTLLVARSGRWRIAG